MIQKYKGICALDDKYFTAKIIIKIPCPDCNEIMEWDLDSTHIEYPEFNVVEEQRMFCEKCEQEWIIPIEIKSAIVEIEVHADKIRRDI